MADIGRLTAAVKHGMTNWRPCYCPTCWQACYPVFEVKLAWQIREVRSALVRTRDTAGTSAGNTRSDLVLPTMYRVPCIMYPVPCTMYLVAIMYLIPCTTYHTPLRTNRAGPGYKAGQLHGWLPPVCGQNCGQRSHLLPGAPDWVELNGEISRSCGLRGHLCCGGNCLLPCIATIAAMSKQGFTIYLSIESNMESTPPDEFEMKEERQCGPCRGYPD